ncbi:MAG: ABC transporter ATP-binding protein [Betaproteobacteria bacterium]
MNTLLSARNLAYGHPGKTLGRDINIDLHAGEIVCVLGPNGGGKTTLFRTLLGLIAPHAGDITLADKSLATCTPAERAQRVAYVPQAAHSQFSYTVQEMVLMGRTAHMDLLAAPGAADHAAANAAIAELRIGHLAGKPFTHISGGERQLVLIARALAQAAPLLVMDEPTASLDFGNRTLVLNEILRLKSAGRGIIFSTHEPDHALQCADRALLLHQGNVLALGAPRDVVTAANLKLLYGVDVELIDGVGARTGQTHCQPAMRIFHP